MNNLLQEEVSGQSETESSDSDESEEEENDDLQVGSAGDYYFPFEKGMLGKDEYERVVPGRYMGDGDDIFMRSVIKNYALEGKDKEHDDKPTGKFFLDEVQAKALATEVLQTHKQLKGATLKKYLDTYWAKSWGHFDVNQTGMIDA